jgi:hypothetical protein
VLDIKIPLKKSLIEHYAEQNKIESVGLWQASMHAQEKYDELATLLNDANIKWGAWGILKLALLGVIDLGSHLAGIGGIPINKVGGLVDMGVDTSQIKLEEYFNYLKITLNLK